jgi:hypothetical protein
MRRGIAVTLAMAGAAGTVAVEGVVTGGPSAGGSEPGARAAQAPVIEAYPPEPRRVGGGNAYDALPGPQECERRRDRRRRRDYTRLSRLPSRPAKDPFVRRAPATIALDLTNEKDQRFRIYVSAGSRRTARRYIARSSGCLEHFPVRRLPTPLVKPVEFDRLLIDAARTASGMSQNELSDLADSGAAPTAPTFVQVVAAAGADPDAVIADASARADVKLQARVSAGQLPAGEVAGLVTADLVRRLAEEPGTPFLFSTRDLPQTETQRGTQLRKGARESVSVSMTTAQPEPPRRVVVWFAFDPPVNKGQQRYYRARCERESYVGLRAWKGGATVRFWRNPSPFIGSRTSWFHHDQRRSMEHRSTSKRRYDTRVEGEQNNSEYSIYGGWIQGSGGGC